MPPPPPPQDDRRGPKEGYQNVPTGPRASRGKPASGPNSTVSTSLSSKAPTLPDQTGSFVPPMTDGDLSAIRSRYLGVDKKKRKIRKMNDRKFVFDWDAQDDTFADDAPGAIGGSRQGAQVMFGRGRIAGMDDGGGSGTRKSGGGGMELADALERRMAAKSGLDERHWTEKKLEEMKERDWRIFREDFSISARGTGFFLPCVTIPTPIRRLHTTSPAFVERVGNSSHDFGMYRKHWIQGTFSYSATGNSNRLTKPRYHRNCGNRSVKHID